MEIIFYENYIKEQRHPKNWLALGNFDGVHIAHKKILQDAVSCAEKYRLNPTVLLFDPHPEVYFNGKNNFLLTTFEEKINKIKRCGIKLAIIKSFERDFAAKSPYDFAKWIKEELNVGGVSIGYDYTFGSKKKGRAKDLIAYGRSLGFLTSSVPPVKTNDGVPISSSLCRDLLKNGRPDEAAKYLNGPYSISGKVVKGDGRGRRLGFPTANLSPPPYKLLPSRGVYLVKVRRNEQNLWGICNIGVRPTFAKETDIIEIHLLNFDEKIYDVKLTLHFIDYIRPEIYFSSPDELALQMKKDLNFARDKISKSLH